MQLPKHWRLKGPRYRLEGARDVQIGAVQFPPPADPQDWEPVSFSGQGTVESFTAVQRAAEGFGDGMVMALVRLEEGPLVTAQLTDVALADVSIGMPVQMVTRKLRHLGPDGLIVYGYKFRPVFTQE